MNRRQVRLVIATLLLTSVTVCGLWPAIAQAPGPSSSAPGRQVPPADASAPVAPGQFEAGEIIVKFRPTASLSAKALVREEYGTARFQSQEEGGLRSTASAAVELWQVPEGRELAVIKRLGSDPRVEYAEPNYLYRAFLVPNDPSLGRQWAHTMIRTPAAWDITTGTANVTIAVLDSGIDENHPDLKAKLVPGYDFVDGDANPHDLNGHGTHVAGVAAAATNNGVGVAGVDWQARIMPVRVLGTDGTGSNWDIAQGILWAYQHGAEVLSLSLGGPDQSQSMRDAINAAHAAGSVIVAGMGNDRQRGNPTMYPAAYNHVIAVAATGPTDTYASYSQYGPHCDIAAPGGDMNGYHDPDGIYSTLPTYPVYLTTPPSYYYTSYDYLHGTSQATPHVAGLAALIWAANPTLTTDEVQQVLKSTADDLGAPGWDPNYGYGRINAVAALRAVTPPAPPTLSPISNPDGDGSYFVEWNEVPNATGYTLQEDTNAAFAAPRDRYNGAESQFTVTGQQPGTWYYRVRASNDAGASPWSNIQSVTVKPPAPVLQPIDNAGNRDAYEVAWSSSPGALGYRLQEADDPAFADPTVRYEGPAASYPVTGQPEGTWYYRVRAYNAAGDGQWSNPQSTSVNPAPLNAPRLLSVANPDGDGDYLVEWLAVAGATAYTLEASRSAYFEAPEAVYTGPALQFAVADQASGTWYYRVRALGQGGNGPWSNRQSVTVTAWAYLPAVMRNHRSDGAAGDLVNGDFEGGPTGWDEYSAAIPPWDLILDSGFPGGVTPHSGIWAVWLGGDYDEVAYIQQRVTVPHDKPYLAYWHWIDSRDVCLPAHDVSSVLIDDEAVDSYELCLLHNTFGWEQRSVDLRAYRGQAVSLRIQIETDGTLNSNLFIDDVSFETSGVLTVREPAGGGVITHAETKMDQNLVPGP